MLRGMCDFIGSLTSQHFEFVRVVTKKVASFEVSSSSEVSSMSISARSHLSRSVIWVLTHKLRLGCSCLPVAHVQELASALLAPAWVVVATFVSMFVLGNSTFACLLAFACSVSPQMWHAPSKCPLLSSSPLFSRPSSL